MKIKNMIFWSLLLISPSTLFAQKAYTVSGSVKDSLTGETLIGASVRILEIPTSGTITNAYGFYSLSVPAGEHTLVFSYTGYGALERKVSGAVTLNTSLSSQNNLREIVVGSNRPNNDQLISPLMGVEKLSMSQINNVPVVLGEKDILKTITLLPGVKSANEGNTGFYVRGGGSDQNLILLDEAPVYNASHLLGFFSTFNSDAIKDVSIYKGGMPAEYGGRLSSVLDIKMLDGNNKDFTVQGGLGLISSRIKLEGPIAKHKGSFMVSARRTYIDLFTKLAKDSIVKHSSLYFYDINAKANYHFDDKNTLYLSGYIGRDVLGLKNTFGTNWGNATGTVRFNHLFNDRLFSNTSLIYSNYNYEIQSFLTKDDFQSTSKITDLNFKEDLQYSLSNTHTLKFGVNVLYHNIAPGDVTSSSSSSTNDKSVEHRYGFENAAYVSDDWKAANKLTILYGLRLSDMVLLGPGTFKTYDANGNTLTSNTYASGSAVKSYLN